jgi:hypothetical protein
MKETHSTLFDDKHKKCQHCKTNTANYWTEPDDCRFGKSTKYLCFSCALSLEHTWIRTAPYEAILEVINDLDHLLGCSSSDMYKRRLAGDPVDPVWRSMEALP